MWTILNRDDAAFMTEESLTRPAAHKVTVETSPVTALHGKGHDLQAVGLADGRRVRASVMYTAKQARLRRRRCIGKAIHASLVEEEIRERAGAW